MEPSTKPSVRNPGATERLGREARDSVALVLLTLALVLTVSFVGIAIS